MWKDPENKLTTFLQKNTTIQIESLILAEWNMNDFQKIANYGTYRYRPATPTSPFYTLQKKYDPLDIGDFYTDAEKSFFTYSDFINDDDEPVIFQSQDVNRRLYFDIEQCFYPFRPRSGINKLLYFNDGNKYIDNITSARRPRYYMATRYDTFKYWNSYRSQVNDSRGPLRYQVSRKQLVFQQATLWIGGHKLRSGDTIVVSGVDPLLNGVRTVTFATSATIDFNVTSNAIIQPVDMTGGSIVLNNTISEFGISKINNPSGYNNSIGYVIEDTAPFVVYEESVPANRIVVKMQTNLGEISKGQISTTSGIKIDDPLGTRSKSSIPQRWKIEYLDEENNWVEAISFDENSIRPLNSSPIVDWDGYLELSYGIKISNPLKYGNQFHLVGYADSNANIPIAGANHGEAYIVGLSATSPGTLYIWDAIEEKWYTEVATYGFSVYEDDDSKKTGVLSSLTDIKYYLQDGKKVYSELIYIKGLRLSVSTMIAPGQTFDLIELSPRLKANISDYVVSFDITKSIGNDNTRLPVGSLLASNGNISLMNIDDAFAYNNENSIVAKYLKPNIKFDIYEIVLNVDGYNKYIPLQSLYAEDFPNAIGGKNAIAIPLRDQFFRFESMRAPDIFLTNTTLTSAISMMLDHCGFSNYVFKGFDDLLKIQVAVTDSIDYPTFFPPRIVNYRVNNTDRVLDLELLYKIPNTNSFYDLEQQWRIYWQTAKTYGFTPVSNEIRNQDKIEFLSNIYDPIIPFFFVNDKKSVAEVLSELAVATQTAMFFDEYNNFVIMPKEYLMPATKDKRKIDLILNGQTTDGDLANIININASEEQILNDGVISYSIKYIQKTAASLSEALVTDQDKKFVYKPVLLWEVGNNQLRSMNDDTGEGSGYSLSAVTLNTTLTDAVPVVSNNIIINNIIDIGESAVWLGRFQGYLYANGEIIRYDAVEYSISGVGNIWITSNREYQNYFSKLPFNGKIYPTGNIRIFAEPYYENLSETTNFNSNDVKLNQSVRYKNGAVQRHGRGQFGTEITTHNAGLPDYWSDNNYVRGVYMSNVSTNLFNTTPLENLVQPPRGSEATLIGQGNNAQGYAESSFRNGIIRNFFRNTYPSDDVVRKLKSTMSGTIQSSALVFTGAQTNREDKIGYVSYIYKQLPYNYQHFGTRMRIIGRYEFDPNKGQSPNGGITPMIYYNVSPTNSTETTSIAGGSGGIAVGLNPNTNHGYFFEICALSNTNLQDYTAVNSATGKTERVLHNIVFYKLVNSSTTNGIAVPVKLWGGLANIIVDEGIFIGQDRLGTQDISTVYDLAVEYVNIGSTRRFYLYVNNKEVAIVDDTNPLPLYYNAGVFIRSESQCMFENFYALQNLQSQNTNANIVGASTSEAFGQDSVTTSDAMRKYSLSGFIKSSYLTGISANSNPLYGVYFEEFGTILRECAYFNIKYDQAFPALRAIIAPTFNNERSYVVSGFNAGAYGAEFLIFNTSDKTISIDETTGNYLRILGITFTQEVSEQLTVDDFFKRLSSFSNPVRSDTTLRSPIAAKEVFEDIESSRKKYGKKEFNIQSDYIQSSDDADKLMEWIMTKVLRKRDKLSVSVFGVPHVQLGDLVTVNYKSNDINYVSTDKIFVVQGIYNSKDASNKSTDLTLIEV